MSGSDTHFSISSTYIVQLTEYYDEINKLLILGNVKWAKHMARKYCFMLCNIFCLFIDAVSFFTGNWNKLYCGNNSSTTARILLMYQQIKEILFKTIQTKNNQF